MVLSGTVLWLTGEGLQFASVVALTVSFGLGLSATIHFLNRLAARGYGRGRSRLGVERATVLVGPALILTSVVLPQSLDALFPGIMHAFKMIEGHGHSHNKNKNI